MTEFVIMLPIFVLIFQGIVKYGQFTRKGSEPPIQAYIKTFDQTTELQKTNPFSPNRHMQPVSGAVDAEKQLKDDSPHNKSGTVEKAALGWEGLTYGAQGLRGTMGESATRVKTTATAADIEGCEGPYTPESDNCVELGGMMGSNSYASSDIEDVTGDAAFAGDMMNDGFSAPKDQPSASGPLGALNSLVDMAGVRPALGAGIRYGTVTGSESETYSFMGRDMEMNAYYNTAVPPATTGGDLGPSADHWRATGVSFLTMHGHDYYNNLPGIAMDQPLDGGSDADFTVDDLPDYQ